MGSPKHLWSGDWQLESEAAAEERARRRGRAAAPAPAELGSPSRPEAERPSRPRRRWSFPSWRPRRPRRPRRRTLRVGALVAVVALLCVGVALGVSALVGGSGSRSPATLAGGAHAWLGADIGSLPVGGVVVTSVVPKGPAYQAGLRRGDVIAEVGDQRVESPDDVDAALAPLQPGSRVKIEFDRGSATYVTQATLRKHPGGSP